jgi:hypothetical protein
MGPLPSTLVFCAVPTGNMNAKRAPITAGIVAALDIHTLNKADAGMEPINSWRPLLIPNTPIIPIANRQCAPEGFFLNLLRPILVHATGSVNPALE